MTDPALNHQWNGLTFGFDPDAEDPPAYELISANGLEDFSTRGGQLDGSATDGRGLSPLWLEAGGWTELVEIYGANTSEWITRRDELRAATAPVVDRYDEAPFVLNYGTEDPRTVFARVVGRKIPVDSEYLVYRFAEAEIDFVANDPKTYGPVVTSSAVSRGSNLASFTSTGSVLSERWQWIVHGPAVNPQLTVHVSGFTDQHIRFVGTVNTGQNLNVEVTPFKLTTTVGGPSFNRYADFDGGNHNLPAAFDAVIAPASAGTQTFSYSSSSGAGTSTFAYRVAWL